MDLPPRDPALDGLDALRAVTRSGSIGRRSAWGMVAAAGALAGLLDITYACVFWGWRAGVAPTRIFQSVAAGLLGPRSFEGGWLTAALGLVLHFLIAVSMAAAYWLGSRRLPALVRQPVWLGAAYGLLLYGVMNGVVVPLSAAGPGPRNPLWMGLTIAVHMLFIGVPIALGAARADRLLNSDALQGDV